VLGRALQGPRFRRLLATQSWSDRHDWSLETCGRLQARCPEEHLCLAKLVPGSPRSGFFALDLQPGISGGGGFDRGRPTPPSSHSRIRCYFARRTGQESWKLQRWTATRLPLVGLTAPRGLGGEQLAFVAVPQAWTTDQSCAFEIIGHPALRPRSTGDGE